MIFNAFPDVNREVALTVADGDLVFVLNQAPGRSETNTSVFRHQVHPLTMPAPISFRYKMASLPTCGISLITSPFSHSLA